MSGYCNFCRMWHSGSCCNPNRYNNIFFEQQHPIKNFESEIKLLKEENKVLRQLLDEIVSCKYCKNGIIFNCDKHYDMFYNIIANINI